MMLYDVVPPEACKLTEKMDEAYNAGDYDRYRELEDEFGELCRKHREKEREEYLEVFGIDINDYSDKSYKLLSLDYGRKENATMAKAKEVDERGYVTYVTLIYLYTRSRRDKFKKNVFERQLLRGCDFSGGYVTGILKELSEKELIDNVVFQHVEGDKYVLASNLTKMNITPKGIDYLIHDPIMKKIKRIIQNGVGYLTQLTERLPK